MIKSFSIFPRLLSLVATMTLGSMAFADAPIPEVSITNSLGSSQSYTIKVTDAPSATGYAGAGTDGTIYVLADQAYTFNIKATEGSNYNIAIREVDASGNDNMGNVNGSQDGAGPDTTYIEDITRTFPTPGTKVIARAYYFYGAGFTRAAYLLGATVDPAVQIVDVTVTIINVEFLNGDNSPIDPAVEALNVSNWVPNIGILNDGFNSTSFFDPDKFRLEVTDPFVSTPSVVVNLQVNDGPEVAYTLDKKSGAKYRGKFLSLVSDTEDDAVGVGSEPSRTILVKLGDLVKMKYEPSHEAVLTHQLQVGRPEAENNNGSNQLMHDILVLKINVVVFRNQADTAPAATRAQVDAEIKAMNERFAQSTIRVTGTINMGGAGDPGVPLPAAMQDGFTIYATAPFFALNADEAAILPYKDSDDNTIDIFYVTDITDINIVGVAYGQAINQTGNDAADGFFVLEEQRDIYTISHEAMHILLNRGHRNDDSTALFWPDGVQAPRAVNGPKRIGPYNETSPSPFGTHDGEQDTITIRDRAEALP